MSHVAASPRPLSPWVVYLGVTTALGAFLGAVGPYGSYLNGPTHVRIAYWIAAGWISLAVLGTAARLALSLARRTGIPAPAAVAGALILANAPLSALIAALARSIWPGLPPMSGFDWYVQVLAITAFTLAAYGLTRAALQGRTPAAAPPAVRPAEAAPPLGPALCLQMDDHYVRVHTAAGSRLVHATLGQAIAAQGDREGLQAHRSWWVAREAVRAHVWNGRRLRLELTNGLSVPVSRSAVARLRAAGWLTPG